MYWEIRMLHISVNVYDTIAMTYSHEEQTCLDSCLNLDHNNSALVSNNSPVTALAPTHAAGTSVDVGTSEILVPECDNGKAKGTEAKKGTDKQRKAQTLLMMKNHGLKMKKSCEVVEHVTNLENPTITVGVTFEDGDTFKKAIRQYAVLNEFEIAAPYSEATRYRGHCKGFRSKNKPCGWRIHASQLQDGLTWQIKKLHNKHTCSSTAKLDQNSMAANAWVRDRVIDTLREKPTTGAGALKAELEKKYNIKLSYYVVWDGRNMTLEELMGKWDDSFDDAFRFKAVVERTNPGSLVEISYEQVGKKKRFKAMFVALKSCVDGFLNGCRPFLGVDSTKAIGSLVGLVISTDAGKGIDSAVTTVFSDGVEHRECMRHLVKNFQKRYRGAAFKKHLWPACRAYNKKHYEHHYNIMKKASPNAIRWIEDNHKHLWNRWKFSILSKCDYVTNNTSETFNSWVRKEKCQHVIQLMDRIRQLIMEKHNLRRNLAMKMYDKILPHIIKELHAQSRNLKYVIHKGHNNTAEVEGTTQQLKTWRHTVDHDNRTCSCN
ncbi:hypothetical protein U9M48_028508 [Paspalum notatum var. saurae]|uniref:Transposase MuDR plant domain-containing protein n=1 Tax=Paspalum notatum var. saurae TaxID=547442 RepID=A0AAQ3X0M9_PASNO